MASSKLDGTNAPYEPQGLIPALIASAKNVFLAPIRPFISRAALRAYLTTILFVITGFALLGLAIAAYVLFYWSYIPRIGFERSIHLQFDNVYKHHDSLGQHASPFPYGTVSLGPDIVSSQGYDVWIELAMPRTPENRDAGNFMVEVDMYAPEEKGSGGKPLSGNILAPLRADISSAFASKDSSSKLATSRRPTILPYRSVYVDLLYKASELPFYLFNFRSEDHKLRIPMFERVSFSNGFQNIPSTLRLEIQSTHRLQLYSAKVHFRARFQGLRWLMYNHRIISAVIFISAFWMTEMVFVGIAWGTLAVYYSKSQQQTLQAKAENIHEVAEAVKHETDDVDSKPVLSDTERTFPTTAGQAPLRYIPDIKREPDEDETAIIVPESVAKAAEADDEDEAEDVDFFDSGIGTSLESSGPARRDSLRRRRGRPGSANLSSNVWREEDERGL